MAIHENVTRALTEAMRAKNSARTNALRNIRAALLTEMKKDNSESVADEVCVQLLRRLEKQRRESIEAFEAAGRTEQVKAERAELDVIGEFLPRLADEAATRTWLEAAIRESGAKAPADAGKVMAALMKVHKGEVDGALAKRLLGELLKG
ncbi:MAG: GatB/YqeY domain-containing protein [Candidatus Eiseniibacteriota bacterium]